jgi:hypothetical protein
MSTLRRLAATPPPAGIAGWRAELITAAVLLGGIVSMFAG